MNFDQPIGALMKLLRDLQKAWSDSKDNVAYYEEKLSGALDQASLMERRVTSVQAAIKLLENANK